MNILVVGGDGYLGSTIISILKSKYNVFIWGSSPGMQNLSNIILRELSIDLILNFAVITVRDEFKFNLNSASSKVNVCYTSKLFQSIQDADLPLIHISTKDVYGLCYTINDVIIKNNSYYYPVKLIDDDHPFNPVTLYGKSKLISEFMSETCNKSTVIRLSSVYGDKHVKNGNWISNIINSLILNNPIILKNGGKQFRDPLHMADLVALIEIVYFNNYWGYKINAGGGNNNIISISEFVNLSNECLKKHGFISSSDIQYLDNNKSELIDYGFAFSNKLSNQMSWFPKIYIRNYIETLVSLSIK